MKNIIDIIYFKYLEIQDIGESKEIQAKKMAEFVRNFFNKSLKEVAIKIKEKNERD